MTHLTPEAKQESDTPLTDAKAWNPNGTDVWELVVPVEVSRNLERQLSAVTAERDALKVDDCAWTPDNEDMWNTSCGEAFTFIDAGPEENNAKYCCYCGGKLINTQHAAIDAARGAK